MSAIRAISTEKVTEGKESDILVEQRKNRPISPHLQIYQPQLTWYMSGGHRITGVVLAGGFYALTCGYAAASIFNVPFDSATLVSAFAALPVVLKVGVKAGLSYPFVYHVFNGIRHLIWDMGKELTLPGVYRTGYVVLAATGVLGTYFLFV